MWHIYWHKISWNKITSVALTILEFRYVQDIIWAGFTDKNIELKTKFSLVFLSLESQMPTYKYKLPLQWNNAKWISFETTKLVKGCIFTVSAHRENYREEKKKGSTA